MSSKFQVNLLIPPEIIKNPSFFDDFEGIEVNSLKFAKIGSEIWRRSPI